MINQLLSIIEKQNDTIVALAARVSGIPAFVGNANQGQTDQRAIPSKTPWPLVKQKLEAFSKVAHPTEEYWKNQANQEAELLAKEVNNGISNHGTTEKRSSEESQQKEEVYYK